MALDGKLVLITGSNAGIGLETAKGLARAGAKLVMACRSEERGRRAMEEIKAAAGERHVVEGRASHVADRGSECDVELMTVDLSSLASVRDFADRFRAKFDKLDCLVNNAGIMGVPYTMTGDGFESQFQVNHLSHFLLSRLLTPLLERSDRDPSIIHVSSHASEYPWSAIKRGGGLRAIAQPSSPTTNSYHPFKAYCQSKLAQVLITREMDRRIGSKIRVNAVHPGRVATDMIVNASPALVRPIMGSVLNLGMRLGIVITAEQGAATSVYLATNPREVTGSGGYFKECKRAKPNRLWEDEGLCREVWEESNAMVGLDAGE